MTKISSTQIDTSDLAALLSGVFVRGAGIRAVERARRRGLERYELGRQLYIELKEISRKLEDLLDYVLQKGVPDASAFQILPHLRDLRDGQPRIREVAESERDHGNVLMEGMPETIEAVGRKLARAVELVESQVRKATEVEIATLSTASARAPSGAVIRAAEDAIARIAAGKRDSDEAWAARLSGQVASADD